MSSHAAYLCFFLGHSHNTEILRKRFLSCRAAHNLEGHPREKDKCPNDGVSLRESQLIPQPHRMHCPQPQAAALSPPAPQREMGTWLERCTSALLELWLQRTCFMPWTHSSDCRGFPVWDRRQEGLLRGRGLQCRE